MFDFFQLLCLLSSFFVTMQDPATNLSDLIYLNNHHHDEVRSNHYQQQGNVRQADLLLSFIILDEIAMELHEKKTVTV